jgi:hypothetical protein
VHRLLFSECMRHFIASPGCGHAPCLAMIVHRGQASERVRMRLSSRVLNSSSTPAVFYHPVGEPQHRSAHQILSPYVCFFCRPPSIHTTVSIRAGRLTEHVSQCQTVSHVSPDSADRRCRFFVGGAVILSELVGCWCTDYSFICDSSCYLFLRAPRPGGVVYTHGAVPRTRNAQAQAGSATRRLSADHCP